MNYIIPNGYLFSVVEAGIKKANRKDMSIIYSSVPATVAGCFTTNRVKAAPVLFCMERIKNGKGQAIVINSGNANACTGEKGVSDTKEIALNVSKLLNMEESNVYVCSTGVIGEPLPMAKITVKMEDAVKSLGDSTISEVAESIMTTDRFAKIVSHSITIGEKNGTVAAIAKGAGMISPDMATMLCFIITDLAVEEKALKKALNLSVNNSFNKITVDGDMSTNDTVLIFANATAGNNIITMESPHFRDFTSSLEHITKELAKMIVRDGEGAGKLIEIQVKGAKSSEDAVTFAKTVANSPLVKTAVYGNDPNWGRIMAALGRSGPPFDPHKVDIYIGNEKIVKNGVASGNEEKAFAFIKREEVEITIDLKQGSFKETVWTCDLTEEYIKINAEYRS